MNSIEKGHIFLASDLVIFPGFTFKQFKETRYYKNQDGVRIIYLEDKQIIDNRNYIVSLFFRKDKIYMVSLICCDIEYSEQEEKKRKRLHDSILSEMGIYGQQLYSWGKVSSDYDERSNISSINIMYF